MSSGSDPPTTAQLFGLVWDELVDVLGTSATATLIRRAAKRGVDAQPGLQRLVIHRPLFEYEYVVPEEWSDDGNGRDALVSLVGALLPILHELTGPIVIQRLRSRPELAEARLVADAEEGSP